MPTKVRRHNVTDTRHNVTKINTEKSKENSAMITLGEMEILDLYYIIL